AVQLMAQDGRFGGALSFSKKSPKLVFYQGARNVAYAADRFQGTIAFWMRLDPESDLPPGYVDPLQITDKKWNDASFFVDFTKDNPRQFRLGVFSDYKFWNPNDRKWDAIPVADRPMVHVKKLPFTKQTWTHVAFTYDGFNRTAGAGTATLYLNGKPQGKISGKQRFTWSPDKVVMMLGINYVGGLDDLAVFDRSLSPEEIGRLWKLPRGVKSLR
ncbi:MAG: LamG domain-containing protein, partial [Planctomycetaceae bacterium]